MPLKLNVGICKKLGLPDYGSIGASCNVEVELDQSLVFDDPAGFQERVMNAYTACRQAVEDELARQHSTNHELSAKGPTAAATTTNRQSNGTGNGTSSHRASQKQLDYARQLAGQIHGLGHRRLDGVATKMFSKPLADLSSLDASGLIDTLKEIKAGKIDLKTVLNGAAA